MRYKELGKTDTKISEICFGGDQIGGTGWGNISINSAKDAVRSALDNGINFFDTADIYGLGRSEEILGQVLSKIRKTSIIATKVGSVLGGRSVDGSPKYLRSALFESLKRLKTDYIDLYQLHQPDPKVPIEDSVGEFCNMQKEGLVRYIGLSNCTLDELRRALKVIPIDSLQLRYNMFYREIEDEIVDYCLKHQISILTYSPLAKGVLAGKYTFNTKFNDSRKNQYAFKGARFRVDIETVDHLKTISETYDISLLSLVLSWTLRTPAITSLIVGVRNASQIKDIANTRIIIPVNSSFNDAVEEVLGERKRKLKKYCWHIEFIEKLARDRRIRGTLERIYKLIKH